MLGILDGLNDSQKQAVTATDKHLLIVAGPGTGKTLTIVRRIAYLLEQGVPAEHIVAVTFTNRAAREMRERIDALLGARANDIFIGTFHVLGLTIIRESLQDRVTICGRDEQIDILKPLVGNSAKAAQQMAEEISRIKNRAGSRGTDTGAWVLGPGSGVTDAGSGVPGPGSRELTDELDLETKRIYEAYEAALDEKGLCDFDDLIRIPVNLFESSKVATQLRSRFRHIIVDEYQDISPAQYRLLACLVGAEEGNTLCAVGDSDQAIYAFRGADVQNFLNFREDFPDAVTCVLEENYRSMARILEGADGLIRHNRRRIEKRLKALRGEGQPITVLSVPDERAESESIVQEIEARMGGTSHYRLAEEKHARDFVETSYSFSDFAVLYRTNAQAKVLREAFTEWGIPCQVIGEKSSFRRNEFMGRLRLLLDATPGQIDLQGFLKGIATEAGVPESHSGLLQHLALAYRDLPWRDALTGIMNELILMTPADAFDPRAQAVALMTLHMAKGLEFKIVFITGCEEGVTPFTLLHDDADIEEERRLFYVGMTRARDELYLLQTRSRFLYGQKLSGEPSRFVSEIPQDLIRAQTLADKPKQKKARQESLF